MYNNRKSPNAHGTNNVLRWRTVENAIKMVLIIWMDSYITSKRHETLTWQKNCCAENRQKVVKWDEMERIIWKDLYTKTERDLVHTPVSLPTPPQKPHTLQTNFFCYCRCHTSVKGRLWGRQNGTLVFCRYLSYAPRVVLYFKLCGHKVWAHALCSVSCVNSGRYFIH